MANFMDIFGDGGGASTKLPALGAAFMNAVAQNESNGKWNVIYGGSTFDDYSQHPQTFVKIESGPNKGDVSSAAGKFQITYSTYKKWAPKLGITDFTPESQVKIAWAIAKAEYKRLTGENLLSVLQSGDEAAIKDAFKTLNKQWTSLPGGIEATQTKDSIYKEFESQRKLGNSSIPKVGMNGDLIYDQGFSDAGTMGFDSSRYADRTLPSYLAELSPEDQKRQDDIITSVQKLLDDGIVVPDGTRDIKQYASQVLDMPAADLLAAGISASGIGKIPMDPNGELTMPSPLAGWANRPAVEGKVVSPGVIDIGTGAATPQPATGRYDTVPKETQQKPMNVVSAQSTAATLLPALASMGVLKAIQTPPAQPTYPTVQDYGQAMATGKATVKAPTTSEPAPMTQGDMRLQALVDAVTKTDKSIFKTTGGLAGTAQLPADYKPDPSIFPADSKSSSGDSTATTMVTGKPDAPVGSMPAAKKTTTESKSTITPLVSAVTGALNNAPVSLSNPVLKPVSNMANTQETKKSTSSSSSSTPATTTQTQSKPVSSDLLAQVESILAEPKTLTSTVKTTTMVPTTVTTPATATTAREAGGDQQESRTGRTTNTQQTSTTTTVMKPVTTTKTTTKTPLGASVSVKKALTPTGDSVVQGDLKDLKTDNTGAKVGGAVTQSKKPLSPLDILGDLLFGNGELTVGLIGGALSGKKVRTNTIQPLYTPTTYTTVSGQKKQSTIGDVINKATGNIGGTTATGSSGSYGSSPGQSTSGLKPGDRAYNADTNTWELKV